MAKPRDENWLAEVRAPGPSGRVFTAFEAVPSHTPELVAGNIGEDDTDVAQFTPGCAAYAGYANGSFANMTAVRAYAASQNARSFSYTPDGDLAGDFIDMEPGDASPADFPAFCRGKGSAWHGGYGSASWIQQIIDAASGAGIARVSYKLVSAHYIGEHICGPGTCGYPQADATQFSDTYLGRSLDATVFSASFFGPAGPPPTPWPLREGDSGVNVTILQENLNRWKFAAPVLATDGSFGAKTKTAVQKALTHWHYSAAGVAAGVADESLWKHLEGPVPVPPPPVNWTYPAPAGLAVTAGPGTAALSWHAAGALHGKAPSGYEVVVYNRPAVPDAGDSSAIVRNDRVTGTRADITGLERGKEFTARVWCLGSPVSSQANYASADFTTG